VNAAQARLCSVPSANPSRFTIQRLTHHSVLLHKGLSIYPLVDFRTSLVQPGLEWIGSVADWRRNITKNDLCIRDKRRKDGGEEDERQQVEHPHRRVGNWTRCVFSCPSSAHREHPCSIPLLETITPILLFIHIYVSTPFILLFFIAYPLNSTFKERQHNACRSP